MPQMSDDAQVLASLAAKCGIETGFHEVGGQYRETSENTKRRLLAAMGVPANNPGETRASLDQIERDEWKQGLPPVTVIYAGRPASVEVVLPHDTGDVTWNVTLGNIAAGHSGTSSFANLPLISERATGATRLQKRILQLPPDLPWGYHSLEVDPGGYEMTLIVTPSRCWLPGDIASGKKVWGLAAQLYLLRSDANWGIGDFSDLRRLFEIASSNGARLVGINPIHSMFLTAPEFASPYSPNHRSLLNVLYIDVTSVPESARSNEVRRLMSNDGFRMDLAECRRARYLEYGKVGDLKLRVLRLLFSEWQATAEAERRERFETFRHIKGKSLRRACIFETLAQHFRQSDTSPPQWRQWLAPFQNPESAEVDQFAKAHTLEVEFYAWLQWLADEQLEKTAAAGEHMSTGLYGDVAVGAHPDGAEAWSNQESFANGVTIGAPPDPFSREGQNWGLPPYNPLALRSTRYAAFIDLIRANMRHCRALRLDHAMGLQHLYWVPDGHFAVDGAYVSYPLHDLLGILALESHRNKCLVIAEDLGTVPEGFRQRIAQADMLSYRVLLFERASGTQSFLPPSNYPKLSIAVAGNHDLSTLRAWWEGADLDLKANMGLIHNSEALERERRQREYDRGQLLEALRAEGLISSDGHMASAELIAVVHSYLCRTGSVLAVAQLDDITREVEPVNIPGTVDQYPNWRRRLSISLEDLATCPEFSAIRNAFSERGTGD